MFFSGNGHKKIDEDIIKAVFSFLASQLWHIRLGADDLLQSRHDLCQYFAQGTDSRLNGFLPFIEVFFRFSQDLGYKYSKRLVDPGVGCGSQVRVKFTLYKVAAFFRYR
ncbi:hypothetical protein THIOM_001256 [Candidatus Thiomargarita nelsonii]|uniref:Uncharacterized protein n=1 Tax=Candidatus Thiomargarita nelsonii TaxID=1003181 RepID=A0A176S479_9GAMM|nr:hypothetical protein THIOM_001256 [Candidatus Thiomargarita nelsonii]